jgi:hypothetical protein
MEFIHTRFSQKESKQKLGNYEKHTIIKSYKNEF